MSVVTFDVTTLIADLVGIGTFAYTQMLALKLVSGVLYAFLGVERPADGGTGQMYWEYVLSSDDWASGTPTWSLLGPFGADEAISTDGLGYISAFDGQDGCVIFVGPTRVTVTSAESAYREIREMSETGAGAGDLVYELTPGGSYYTADSQYVPNATTAEIVVSPEDVDVKWCEYPYDEGGGYPGAPPFIYVGDVLFE